MNETPKVSEGGAWWQLTVEIPRNVAEDAGAALMEHGAMGVQIEDGSLEPVPAFAKSAPFARRSARTSDNLALLIASYRDTQASGGQQMDAASLAKEASEALNTVGAQISASKIHAVKRQDRDWAETWKEYFKPTKLGRRMWIVPTWEKHFEAPANSEVLLMDPGMAFGTGQHATTAMCLRAVELYADSVPITQRVNRRMLDLGCGTGVLAIGGQKLGLGYVYAIDNDPLAVSATQENAALNKVNVRVDDTAIEHVNEKFDLLVANILAQPLIDLRESILQCVVPGGTLVLSGILREQADEVLHAYQRAATNMGLRDLPLEYHWTHGQWAALQLHRP